jgi:hypothetical protein
MPRVVVLRPDQLDDVGQYNIQFLAQGDSWFSLGAVPFWNTTNLLGYLSTSVTQACAVNCAKPGRELQHMVDTAFEQTFMGLVAGRIRRPWSGILLSGGGNDLIDVLEVSPDAKRAMRLLLRSDEWTAAPGAERYICNEGWITFADHLTNVIQTFLAYRDSQPDNFGRPVVMHTYDLATPRDVHPPGPWLFKALVAYGIPESDWIPLAAALFARLRTLLLHVAATTPDKSLHIVDTQGRLTAAATTDHGDTLHWENEIHPTTAGYELLGAQWQPVLDALFDPGA